jgi:hypothetical protein
MKALLEKLKLTKVESSPPPLIPRVLSSLPPPPLPVRQEPKPIVVLGDPIELMRQRELTTPKLELKPVIGNPINGPFPSSRIIGVSEMVSVPVSSNGPSLSDYQNPPNVTYAGGKPIYLTDTQVQADVGRWALYPAIQNVDMAQNTFINLPQITLPVINLVGPTGTPGIMNMTDNNGTSHILESIDANLYFDGELLAKAGDIQNISDWALYPAIGDVDMNGKKLIYSGAFVDVGSNGGSIEINSKQGGASIYLNSQDAVIVGATTDGNSFLQTDQLAKLGGAFGNVGQFLSITETDANKHITWVDAPTSVTEINPGNNTGIIGLNSTGGSVTITNPAPGVINFEVPPNVTSLNGINGAVDLTSVDGSITITPVPLIDSIDLSVPAIAVLEGDVATLQADVVTINGEIATLQGEVGVIQGQILGIDAELTTLTGGLATVTAAVGVIESSYVTQVSGCKGSVQLAGTGGITISPNTGTGVITIDGSGASAGVSSITTNGASPTTGIVNLVNGTGITLTPSGQNITIASTGITGVTSLNSLTGALTITAGTNISVVASGGNTLTINQINVPVTNRVSAETTQRMTTSYVTIATLTLPTTAIYDVDVFGIVQFTTDSNTNYDISLRIQQNGTTIGFGFVSSISGVGHNLTFPIQATGLAVPSGTQTYTLQGFVTGVPAGVNINSVRYQLSAIGNLA